MSRHSTRQMFALGLAAALALALPAVAIQQNSPPAVVTFAKNTTTQRVITFAQEDFRVEGDGVLDCITINSLPDTNAGVLTLGETPLVVGDMVGASALTGLRFYPLEQPTVATTNFTFTPRFADGLYGTTTPVGIYLLTAENSSPIAQDLSFTTYRDVAYTGRLTGTDPEGDLITFQLVDKPARGAVEIADDGSGSFVYTPYEGKTGKDSFTFVAIDGVGNASNQATVKVKIEKAKTKVTYADMAGHASYNAALRLAETGALVGEQVGGSYYFNPETPVSRSQFVALAMSTLGLHALEGVTTTGFADDGVIPTWAKGYVSSALKAGTLQGYPDDNGQVVFSPTQTVTKGEAAVLLDRMLNVTDVVATSIYTDVAAVPTWAWQSAVNLESAGVLRTDSQGALDLNVGITRGEAAQLLAGALTVLEARETSGWLKW